TGSPDGSGRVLSRDGYNDCRDQMRPHRPEHACRCRGGTATLTMACLDVKVLDSKAYIFRDYANGGSLAGREIQSINGGPTTHIISTMLAAESEDGDGQASRQRNIGGHFGLDLITLLGLRAPYTLVLAGDGTKNVEQVRVAGLRHEDLKRMSKMLFPQDQPKKDFAELKFLDNGQIAQLTYSSFGTSSEEGQKFMK